MKRLWTLLPLLIAAVLVYVPMGGWKLLYGGQGDDDPASRTYGAQYDVPGFEWVVLLNSQGLSTADAKLDFFDSCLIRYRGSVREVISHYSWYARLSRDTLVEYRAPAGSVPAGVLCPDGAVFLLPQEALIGFNARVAEREAYEAQLAGEVQAALGAPQRGPAYAVDDTIRWVEAVNPSGLESFGYRIAFLDACGIEEGGTVRAIRQTSQGMLYAYTPEAGLGFRGIGIPCPVDTVFLEHGPQRRYF
jgi:hypothetical protein